MRSPESSPFTPGRPASHDVFVGRSAQLEALRVMSARAAQGKFELGFVTGERGIGKSSLASLARDRAEVQNGIVGAHVNLSDVDELEKAVGLVFSALTQENRQRAWFGKIKSLLGDKLEIGALGVSVKLNLSSDDVRSLTDDFGAAMRRVISQFDGERKALMLILDNINGLATTARFANWIKGVVDGAAFSGEPTPVCILVVGFEEQRRKMMEHQPSVGRIFRLMDIKPWSDEETQKFYRDRFSESSVGISDDALELMLSYTGGLPMMAHHIGDAVWCASHDESIGKKDAENGIVAAVEIVGRKFLEPQVFQELRSEKYRPILRKFIGRIKPCQPEFSLSEIANFISMEENRLLRYFLRRMRRLEVFLPSESGKRGVYRFSNRLYALYFWIEATKCGAARQSPLSGFARR